MAKMTRPTSGQVKHRDSTVGLTLDMLLAHGTINPQLPPYNYSDKLTLEERTAILGQVLKDATGSFRTVVLDFKYFVSKIHIKDMRDFSVIGAGALIGEGDDDGTFVLGVENCTNVRMSGFTVSTTGSREIGVKVWGSGATCSLNHFELNVTNTVCGWQFGDFAYPDNLVSEITVANGYTFNVTEVGRIIGSQCIIEFSNYQGVALGTQTTNTTLFTVAGGVLHMNGGEGQMTTISTGVGFRIQPIESPMMSGLGGNHYGHVLLNGVSFECASIQMLASNPRGVTNIKQGSGSFVMESVTGYASLDTTDLLQGESSFTGRVYVAPSCYFHRTGNLPTQNYVSGMGAGCKVHIAAGAYGDEYRTGLQLFRPNLQIPQYDQRRIFEATNLGGAVVNNGSEVSLGFVSKSATGDNAFYYGAYSGGLFTVPRGGLKDVRLNLSCALANAYSAGSVMLSCVVDNSTIAGQASIPWQAVSTEFYIGDLNEGQTISVKILNLSGAAVSFGSTNSDKFVVSARTR